MAWERRTSVSDRVSIADLIFFTWTHKNQLFRCNLLTVCAFVLADKGVAVEVGQWQRMVVRTAV